ncbi:MAG TPA: hypothetical protein VFM63_05065, partial [Pyrinomonadaceae bacterium]|nr:hypothetical protein [Pyrinomonadaceae bacterium]
VTGFGGMPDPAAAGAVPLMFTGIHIMEPRIFDYIPPDIFSDSVTHVYPQAMAKGEVIAAHVANGKWRELSTLKRYLEISIEMLKESRVSNMAGPRCDISPSASVVDSILWDSVRIGDRALVNRCVLGDDVTVPADEVIENSIVVRRDLVEGKKRPEKSLPGDFRGENFVVPL